jgi:hypothetical protein
MPSPFPGMDPFIEGHVWHDFHHAAISEIQAVLVPQIRPRYVARVEERVVIEHAPEPLPRSLRPNVTIARTGVHAPPQAGTAILDVPATVRLPLPSREIERCLELRLRDECETLVTVIEVLSPANKRAGTDSRREYLAKRETVLLSEVHLVEIDLLRGGERLPMEGSLPPGDFYAIVSPSWRRPASFVWHWTLHSALPRIQIPLLQRDEQVELDLQRVFDSVYDRAGYDYSLGYGGAVEPPVDEGTAAWIEETLARRDR